MLRMLQVLPHNKRPISAGELQLCAANAAKTCLYAQYVLACLLGCLLGKCACVVGCHVKMTWAADAIVPCRTRQATTAA
jgi:hypothetical protein